MSKSDLVLFTVDNGNNCRAGLPPFNLMDDFDKRSRRVGILQDASKIAFSPDDKLYAIRGCELYRGTMPSAEGLNWFEGAKRVGKTDWEKMKHIFFSPQGILYVVTHGGEFLKAPPPTNENVPWLFSQAKKIGTAGWHNFYALFFDPEGVLYGVTADKFIKALPPTEAEQDWVAHATEIGDGGGWAQLSHFMAFTPDGNLWAVDRGNGNIYTGPPPTNREENWLARVQQLGLSYNIYKHLCFTSDKTIMKVVSLEFQAEHGKVIDEGVQIVAEQKYNNKESTTPLNSTFEFCKTFTHECSFSRDSGIEIAAQAESTVKTGVPMIAEGEMTITVSATTTHNWNIGETNTTETSFTMSSTFVVDPGKAVKQTATVQKATMNIPYTAQVVTMLGYETTISGSYNGVCYFHLQVKQVDF